MTGSRHRVIRATVFSCELVDYSQFEIQLGFSPDHHVDQKVRGFFEFIIVDPLKDCIR